jgi:CO dehydrogenase/acetyl-CoA synthase alpha subunit
MNDILTLDTFSKAEWDLIEEALVAAVAKAARGVENAANEYEYRAYSAKFAMLDDLVLKVQDVKP